MEYKNKIIHKTGSYTHKNNMHIGLRHYYQVIKRVGHNTGIYISLRLTEFKQRVNDKASGTEVIFYSR